jgi:signal transduction histidine kinase
MKSALLANVSHELQTPLVSIKGYTEMILKGRLGSVTEEQKRGLEISLRNIDRLIGMIDNLLSLARSEKETPLQVSSFPLWDLVEECAELVRSQAEARKITLTTSYMTEDLTVKADRARISQVFFNLLSNAIKFNKDGGQIQLTVRRGKRGYLIVEVRDTGVGIPSDSLERIFDRHYKVPRPGGAPPEGAGLGLSITRDILRLHGCTVRADSKPDEGSVFTFTLPLAASAPESEAGGSQEGGERNSARTAFGNGRGR